MSMMNEKFEEKQKNSSNKNGANGVTFNAYDSEITISQRDSAKINNAFSINSPLTSLRSLSWRSTSRSLSDPHSEETAEDAGMKKIDRNNQEEKVERSNLLNMVKATVKSIIESSLSAGHILDSDHKSLDQFFVLMENVLQHRLKGSKRIFGQSRSFWPPLEAVERFHHSAASITESVRSLPGVKTYLGKCRAWLRLALMQKKLAEYFQVFIDHRKVFSEWYDPASLLMNDEASIMLGHLVGLNCIDANLCMKEYDLDNMATVIDYSLLVKDADVLTNQCEDEETAMQSLLNQKNYLEERNRHLETNLVELQKKVERLESTNQKQTGEFESLRDEAQLTKNENEKLKNDLARMSQVHEQTLQKCLEDLDQERSKLIQSKAESDAALSELKDQLKQETEMRLDVEKEVEHEMSLRQELELALQHQERDLGHKQEALVALREQLDVVKTENADLCVKLQTQLDASRSDDVVGGWRDELEEAKRQQDVAREQAGRYSNQLDDSEKARHVLETNLSIEREWREGLEREAENRKQEMILLREKLEMMSTMKEEMEKIREERYRFRDEQS